MAVRLKSGPHRLIVTLLPIGGRPMQSTTEAREPTLEIFEDLAGQK